MADLNMMYKEAGLQGIIPYALGSTGQGYRFLCDKIKTGEPFWILFSPFGVPFIDADEEHVYMYIYSDPAIADAKVEELVGSKNYTTESCLVDYAKPREAGGAEKVAETAAALMKRYRDFGATHLRLDDSLWLDMKDLAPVATYDGYMSQSLPIRNAALNAALYSTMQDVRAGLPCDPLIAYFWRVFTDSSFVLPARPIRQLKPGEVLTDDLLEPHLLEVDEGERAIAVFTDHDLLRTFGAAMGMKPEEYTVCYTPTYEYLMDYLDGIPNWRIVLNPLFGDFVFDKDLFQTMETIALNDAAMSAAGN